jgi:hypothetical protein
MMRRRILLPLIGLLVLLLGAAVFYSFTASRNLFQNPSFEEGRSSWSWKKDHPGWNDFEVTAERARLGRHSARRELKQGMIPVSVPNPDAS